MKKKINLVSIVLASTIFLLWLMNPSYAMFKEYSSEVSNKYIKISRRRLVNGVVFSIYEKQTYSYEPYSGDISLLSTEKYYGFAMNFFKTSNIQAKH